MFNEYKGTIDIVQILKDKYNYTFNGSLEDLAMQSFVEQEGEGVDALFWITIDDEKYLFKPLKCAEYNMWGELLSEKLALKLGLPAASYRAASFGDLKGVITKNFLKEDETLILGSILYQEFFNNYQYVKDTENLIYDENFRELYNIPESFLKLDPYIRRRKTFQHFNNVDDSWSIVSSLLKDDISTYELVSYLVKLAIFDCITLQADRHPNNWGFIKKHDKYTPAPFFDSSASFGLGYPDMDYKVGNFKSQVLNAKWTGYDAIDKAIYSVKPSLTLTNTYDAKTDTMIKPTFTELFEEIIASGDPSITAIAEEYINQINEDVIEELITSIEDENEIRMDNNIHFYITYIIDYNLAKLKDIINKYKKDDNNEKTR